MIDQSQRTNSLSFGSIEIDKTVQKLKSTSDSRKRYEYLLWIAKKLPTLPENSLNESNKVKGCISKVYVLCEIVEGKLFWKGYSDALITKGMLALLINGLNNLSPKQIMKVDPTFIEATGLNKSLTPSRANGFLNIFLKMKAQAQSFL